MGTDTPLACLSDKPQLLYNYFKQLFAQVTNPPLDANFEELVTSLYTYLGREGNLLERDAEARAPDQAEAADPVSNDDLEKLREVAIGDLKAVTLPMLFNVAEGEAGLEKALDELLRRRRQGGEGRRVDPDPVRPRRRRGQGADPAACSRPRPCTTT